MFYTAVQALTIMLCFPCMPSRFSKNLKPLRSVGKGIPLLKMNEELKKKEEVEDKFTCDILFLVHMHKCYCMVINYMIVS